METKKNPKVAVNRNSSIYFAVALALVLVMINLALNFQSVNQNNEYLSDLNLEIIDDEIIPITDHPEKLPPEQKQPVVPDDIEEVPDDQEIEESLIDATDLNEDEPIIDVEDLNDIVEEPIEEDIPFPLIEHVPTFPGCEKGNNEQKRKCMSDKIAKHVQKKFNTDLAEGLGLSGVQKIYVMFKINKKGEIIGVQSRAPHPKLQKEAERVINLLPKMKPGMQRDKPVNVKYSLPIIFKVQD